MKKIATAALLLITSLHAYANINQLHHQALDQYHHHHLQAAIQTFSHHKLKDLIRQGHQEKLSNQQLALIINDYAFFLIKNHQYHQATTVLNQAIKLDNHRAVAFYNRAEIAHHTHHDALATSNIRIYAYLRQVTPFLSFDPESNTYRLQDKRPELVKTYLSKDDLIHLDQHNYRAFHQDKVFTHYLDETIHRRRVNWNAVVDVDGTSYDDATHQPFTGVRIKRYPSGHLSIHAEYVNGQKDGNFISYHQNGHIYIQATYKHGQKIGHYVKYFPSGQLAEASTLFEQNHYKKMISYYKNGQLKSEQYSNGKYRYYFDDGTLNVSGYYQHAKRNGLWSRYNSNGVLYNQGHYKNDVKTGVWTEANYDTGIKGNYNQVYYTGIPNQYGISPISSFYYHITHHGTRCEIHGHHQYLDVIDLTKEHPIPLDVYIKQHQ